jgi:hypothetical protein
LLEQTEGQTGMRSAFAVMLLIQTQPRRSHAYAGPTKKGGNFSPQALPPSLTHSPGSFLGMERDVREESVKVPEMGKRFACYHSLRKG